MKQNVTNMNKTIIRILLAAAAVLILCGAAVGAVGAVTQAGSWTGDVFTPDPDGYTNPANLVDDLNKTGTDGKVHTGTADGSESGTIQLLKNVKLGGTLTIGNPYDTDYFILDLNDKVLSRNSTSGDFSVITVDSDHLFLTLTDSAEKKTVKYFNVDDKGLWTLAEKCVSTKYSVTGGCITGGSGQGGGVTLLPGACFEMDGGNIVGNSACGDSINDQGGGVYVLGDEDSGTVSTFTMIDGKIIGNYANSGGGVYVGNYGRYDLSAWMDEDGGSIEKNSAKQGGGVYVAGGSFSMSVKTVIRGNSAPQGGGVYVGSGEFTMGDPECYIIGNKAEGPYSNGGGVYVTGTNSTFKMFDGIITGNHVSIGGGGGVAIFSGAGFEMSGGAITENTAFIGGGGVFVTDTNSTFKMSGSSSITKNSAAEGSGVYILDADGGTFEMSGSAGISGNTATVEGGYGVIFDSESTFNVSGTPVIRDNKDVDGKANNVYLNGTDRLKLTGSFTGGEIRITSVAEVAPAAGEKFGTAADSTSGAEHFIADGNSRLVGKISGGLLVWVEKTKKESASQGASIWLTAEPTPTETPTPTPTPTSEVPQVKPAADETKPAASPAPVAGVLAGLGAVLTILGLRRK